MKTTIKSLIAMAFAGLLFVGCATKHADSCCAPMSGMKLVEYEYKTVRLENIQTTPLAVQLNEAAKGGWKLIGPQTGVSGDFVFERPKQ